MKHDEKKKVLINWFYVFLLQKTRLMTHSLYFFYIYTGIAREIIKKFISSFGATVKR